MSPLSNATIDGSCDGGFLECARIHNRGAIPHESTERAVANLLQQLRDKDPKDVHVIGHGNSGIVITGTGEEKVESSKYVGKSNQADWERHFFRLRNRVASLRFWACHLGADEAGATFLYNVAMVINAPTFGSTGFVYCEQTDLTLEDGATWLKAEPKPDGKPKDSRAPKPYVSPIPHEIRRLDQRAPVIRPEHVRSVRLWSGRVDGAMIHASPQVLPAPDVADVLSLVEFDNPSRLPGPPAAIIDHTLALRIETQHGAEQRLFHVYNERLVKDLTSDSWYNAPDFARIRQRA